MSKEIEIDKLIEQVNNAEKQIGKWANEIGQSREEIAGLKEQINARLSEVEKLKEQVEALRKLSEQVEALQKQLQESAKQSPLDNDDQKGNDDSDRNRSGDARQLWASLSPEAKRLADERFRQLRETDPALAEKVVTDSAEAAQFLQVAQEAAKRPPGSLFEVFENKKPVDTDKVRDVYRRLFGLTSEEAAGGKGAPERRPAEGFRPPSDRQKSRVVPTDGGLPRPDSSA